MGRAVLVGDTSDMDGNATGCYEGVSCHMSG